MSPDELPEDLVDAVTELYREPPEEFVRHRDALVRELRHARRRDESAAVKRLRRPARAAWALNSIYFTSPAVLERVAGAVAAVVDAQDGRGDLREATRTLRTAVQDAADVAARATGAGLASERAGLVPALMAVIADADSFALLRSGRLGEVPTAGSIDALTRPPSLDVAPLQAVPTPADQAESADPAALDRAQRAVDKAEDAVATAQAEVDRTDTDADVAKAAVDEASLALRQAETRVRQERARLQESRRDAKLARDRLRDAERSLAVARGRLRRIAPDG